jgi:hypothetical protein
MTKMESATGSIYLRDPGVDRHHLIIQSTHSIFPGSWSPLQLPSYCSYTQFVSFIKAGYPYISSHPLPMLLAPELLFLRNSLRIPCEVQWSVDDWRSGFSLHHFTTPRSSDHRDSLRACNRVIFKIHLEAVVERL